MGNTVLCALVSHIAGRARVVVVEHFDIYIYTSNPPPERKYIGSTIKEGDTTNGEKISFLLF